MREVRLCTPLRNAPNAVTMVRRHSSRSILVEVRSFEREIIVSGVDQRAVEPLYGEPSGERRSDGGSAGSADVKIETARIEPLECVFERRKRPDLVHAAGDPATGET